MIESQLHWYSFGLRIRQAEVLLDNPVTGASATYPVIGVECLNRLRSAFTATGLSGLAQNLIARKLDSIEDFYQQFAGPGSVPWRSINPFRAEVRSIYPLVPELLPDGDREAFELGYQICLVRQPPDGEPESAVIWRNADQVAGLLDSLQLTAEDVMPPAANVSNDARRRLGRIAVADDIDEAAIWIRLEEGLLRMAELASPGLRVDVANRTVRVAGVDILVTEAEAAFVDELLRAGIEQSISSTRLRDRRPGVFPERIDRLKQGFDPRIRRWIGSSTAGYWLRRDPE